MPENTAETSNFTQVRVNLLHRGNLLALASCVVADLVRLTGLRIVSGKNGLFVAMPTRQVQDNDYQDIYFPVSQAVREELQSVILAAYEVLKNSSPAE